MIIRVGQEEYMNYEATGVIMYGKLGETGNAHPLYKVGNDTDNIHLMNMQLHAIKHFVQCFIYRRSLLRRPVHWLGVIVDEPPIAVCQLSLVIINHFWELKHVNALLDC